MAVPNIPDISRTEATELEANLSAKAASLSYKALVENLEAASEALTLHESRACELASELARNRQEQRKNEADRMFKRKNPDTSPDDVGEALRLEEEALIKQQRQHREDEPRRKVFAAVLANELRKRQALSEHLALQQHHKNHQGNAEVRIQAARRAVCQAIMSVCADKTMNTDVVDPSIFFTNIIGHFEVKALLARMVGEEKAGIKRALEATNKDLG